MAATYTQLLFHLVFSTKHRQPIITPQLQKPLYAYIGGIISEFRGALLAAGGMPDHVHLLVNLRAVPSIAKHVNAIKGSSSRWLNKENRAERFYWQAGYGAFSVSTSQLPSVRRYIENQQEHHRRIAFKDEIVMLLERHGVNYERRFLFD